MEAADAGRVLALSNQIQTVRQILLMIDDGAKITSMTLTRPEPPQSEPPEEAALPPPVPVEEGEEEESGREEEPAQPDEERPPPEPEEPPTVPEEPSTGEVTVSTEGLTYPPQMLQSIRTQEMQIWKSAYEELERLGVTNVPQPPAEPQPPTEPAAAPPSAPAPARERRFGRSGAPRR